MSMDLRKSFAPGMVCLPEENFDRNDELNMMNALCRVAVAFRHGIMTCVAATVVNKNYLVISSGNATDNKQLLISGGKVKDKVYTNHLKRQKANVSSFRTVCSGLASFKNNTLKIHTDIMSICKELESVDKPLENIEDTRRIYESCKAKVYGVLNSLGLSDNERQRWLKNSAATLPTNLTIDQQLENQLILTKDCLLYLHEITSIVKYVNIVENALDAGLSFLRNEKDSFIIVNGPGVHAEMIVIDYVLNRFKEIDRIVLGISKLKCAIVLYCKG